MKPTHNNEPTHLVCLNINHSFLESCILAKPDSVQKNASPNMTWARKSSPNHHYGIMSVAGLRPLLVAGVSATTV